MAEIESGYSDIHCEACVYSGDDLVCGNKQSHKFGKLIRTTSYCVKGVMFIEVDGKDFETSFEEEIAARGNEGDFVLRGDNYL